MTAEPPFPRIGIAGVGLIGGSVALAARAAWPGVRLVGMDVSENGARARERGVVDDVATTLTSLPPVDLLVLAMPVSGIAESMHQVAQVAGSAVVTDVGSTKRTVLAAAAAAGVRRFVGGHPMAGSERGGLDEARADLFVRRPWLLLDAGAGSDVNDRVQAFTVALGAVPQWIDSEIHDRVVAYLSHLPQLLAVALMNTAAEAIPPGARGIGGRAFEEMTRLASSPSGMWQDILCDNADYVNEALLALARALPTVDRLKDPRWVEQAFARAEAAKANRR
jgi:prephenate dehydrogenase